MCWLPILILIVAFEIICLQPALAGLSVKYLPGFERPLPFQLETGYIGVGEADEVQLFYYFIKSQSNPKVDPLIYWFTGGPGCSPLSGIFFEFGPITLDTRAYNGSLPTLSLNPHAYTKVASMIFVDLPVGTGFSYATTQKANYSDDLQSANHAYEFLRKWLIEHQEYLNNPFYVAGDSYSGITVPIVTQVISNGIDRGIKPWINLKGYILGNPLTFAGQDYYRIPFAHGMGLIPDELYKSLVTNCEEESIHNGPTNPLCSRDMHTFTEIFLHSILFSPQNMSSKMNSFALFCVISICVFSCRSVESASRSAPAPAVDCNNLVLNLADCLSFVTNGSTEKKPEGTCCSGLKMVLKTDAECLCEGFKNSAQLGVVLNVTKAMALPAACHVSAPSVSNCGLSTDTGAAPALSPIAGSPSISAVAPTTAEGVNVVAPVPAPGTSDSTTLAGLSIGQLGLTLVIAVFCWF